MNIPKNGRIAIIDDKFDHAKPLIEIFGKNRLPFVYYDGSQKNLPEEDTNFNDIRILFLDIYLTGDAHRTDKEIKSTLIPVLNRIISTDNYPYLLVYWSRHESEHGKLIQEIFENELKNKSPINYLSLNKSQYFKLNGDKTTLYNKRIPELFGRIEKAINKVPIYGHIMKWENIIHDAADRTVSEVFKIDPPSTWDKNSKFLFYKLANSFSGKQMGVLEGNAQIKSAFYSMNFVFNDSLEDLISKSSSLTVFDKLLQPRYENNEVLFSLNKKLLFSDDHADKYSPGILFEVSPKGGQDKHDYDNILSSWINRSLFYKKIEKEIKPELKNLKGKKRISKIKNLRGKKTKDLRDLIRKDFKKIEVNVTPLCDYVQGKLVYHRILPGLIINARHLQFINTTSEAIFISPEFKLPDSKQSEYYLFLLDFRYFNSLHKKSFEMEMKPILRIRQALLSEIQSKLSRHVNRQGILFLSE
jgi:hypothetical protein